MTRIHLNSEVEPHDKTREKGGGGTMQQLYRMAPSAIGWSAIVLQYALIARYKTEGDLFIAPA
jgi:hypothetical protein